MIRFLVNVFQLFQFQRRRVERLIRNGFAIDAVIARGKVNSMKVVNPRPFGDGTECWLVAPSFRIDKKNQTIIDGQIIVDEKGRHLREAEVARLLQVTVEMFSYR